MTPEEDGKLPEVNVTGTPEFEDRRESPRKGHTTQSETDPAPIRQASYGVLFVAAVFVVNAMETGSYRTPWPVAIATLLIGLGLFVYSRRLEKRSKS